MSRELTAIEEQNISGRAYQYARNVKLGQSLQNAFGGIGGIAGQGSISSMVVSSEAEAWISGYKAALADRDSE